MATTRGEAMRKTLRQALTRLKYDRPRIVQKGRKISIKALAEEAEVTDSLIHNKYPEFVEKVRVLQGKAIKDQRDAKADQLKKVRAEKRELQAQLTEAKTQLAVLGTQNAVLLERVRFLEGQAASGGKVVSLGQHFE